MNNLEVLKQGYEGFAEGDLQKATANWAPGIVWHECTGMPMVMNDGIYTGVQEVISEVLARIPEFIDDFSIDISDFVDGGDKIVMVGYYKGTWKQTGRKFKANAMHTWTFKNGKLTHFFQAVDTAEITGAVHKAEAGQKMSSVM